MVIVALLIVLNSGGPEEDGGVGIAGNGGGEKPIVPNPPDNPGGGNPIPPDGPIELPSVPDNPGPTPDAIDLLPYVDTWKLENVESVDDAIRINKIGTVLAGYDPRRTVAVDGGYSFDMVVTAKVPNGFRISLPVMGRRIHIPIDLATPEIPEGMRLSELMTESGGQKRQIYSNENLKVGSGSAKQVTVFVDQREQLHIMLYIDGEKVIHW